MDSLVFLLFYSRLPLRGNVHRKIFTFIDFEDPLYFNVNKGVSLGSTSDQDRILDCFLFNYVFGKNRYNFFIPQCNKSSEPVCLSLSLTSTEMQITTPSDITRFERGSNGRSYIRGRVLRRRALNSNISTSTVVQRDSRSLHRTRSICFLVFHTHMFLRYCY